jgi:hypothetical protein
MQRNQKKVSAGGTIVLLLLLLNVIMLKQGFISNEAWYKLAFVTVPLLLIAIVLFRKKII